MRNRYIPRNILVRMFLGMYLVLSRLCGGGEIRTHGPLSWSPVFKTGAFNHSATPPYNILFCYGVASCPPGPFPLAYSLTLISASSEALLQKRMKCELFTFHSHTSIYSLRSYEESLLATQWLRSSLTSFAGKSKVVCFYPISATPLYKQVVILF